MGYIYIYIGGWGRELGPPNREIVSFRSCVRAWRPCEVVSEWKCSRHRLYLLSLSPGRSYLVSCVILGSVRILNDFLRVPVSYLWVWMSSQCSPVLLISGEFKLGLIEFPWVLSEFLWLLMSSDEFKRGLSEFRWVLSEFLWILVSSTEFLWGLLSSSEFKRAPESSQWVVVSSSKLYSFLNECKGTLHVSISPPSPNLPISFSWHYGYIPCIYIHTECIYIYMYISIEIFTIGE